jgi:hypothetical protein
MRKIERLRREALESCQYRGHDMSPFRTHDYWTKKRYANCKVCGMQVVINSRPAPNEIDIGGEAVSLDCGSESWFNAVGSIRR